MSAPPGTQLPQEEKDEWSDEFSRFLDGDMVTREEKGKKREFILYGSDASSWHAWCGGGGDIRRGALVVGQQVAALQLEGGLCGGPRRST